uniref:Phosphatidylcholine transfer protein n=2 Tax=Parascaris univalens TaxID=6257 RepID=A0A915CA88_PARUN
MSTRRTFCSFLRLMWRYRFTTVIPPRRRGERRWNWRRWLRWRPPLLVAISAGFSFQEKGIPDDVIQAEKCVHVSDGESDEWEVMVEQDDLRVVRRPRGTLDLYEYRCSGTYRDISARDFVDAQIDLEYRQKWDSNVLKLELLYSDEETDSQVVRWIAKFPYPMYPREYIFVRRRYVDETEQSMVIASNALDRELFPLNSEYVRVQTYRSVMVVRAHRCFDEKGLDFVLTYYDNPESTIPNCAYNWIVNHGGPHFLQQVHAAALELEKLRTQRSLDELEMRASEAANDGEKSEYSAETDLTSGDEGVEPEQGASAGEVKKADMRETSQSNRPALQAWYERLTAVEIPEFLEMID